ncbi:MORN repeat containing protein [Trypanosoma cruzi]|nr:MORN repeat containing protein [Trypanosoma cruzi]
MLTVTEDKIPVPLIPDTELCDVRIGATDPALFFCINLDSPCQVKIEFQEFNTAARCVLLLSSTDPRPSIHTAVWKCLSPEQKKTVTLLPADPSYRVGPLYLAVRYVEKSGNTFVRLNLTLQEQYEAEWYSQSNGALYYGMWSGFCYHGRGRCIYGVEPELMEKGTLKWTGRSLRQQSNSLSWQFDSTPPVEDAKLAISRKDLGWSILPLPSPTLELYDGEWVHGKKEGLGAYQWADRAYWGMWKGGGREGLGVLCTCDGYRYEGEWLNDKRDGVGNAFYPDGTQYMGGWKKDKRSGEGLFNYTNGIVIRGTWEEDVLCPTVTATYADGSSYVGEWAHDCRHGKGRHIDAIGNVFDGMWDMDKRTGNGTLQFINNVICVALWEEDVRKDGTFNFPNGEAYVGDWNDEKYIREGQGKCTYPNGDVYEGSWKNDKRHGFGKFVYSGEKCVYEGEWKEGKRHGIGTQETEEGTYQGEFQDDMRYGHGLHLGRAGSMHRGIWRDNGCIGPGVRFDSKKGIMYDGLFLLGKLQSVGTSRTESDIYEGTWCDGERHGVGVVSLPNGDVVRHLWHRGVPQDGHVIYMYRDGDKYEGEWKDGRRCGKGTQWYADGSVYMGEWLDDKRHGSGSYTDVRGETLVGEWCGGERMDVKGSLRLLDGTVYEGEMRLGKPHGKGRLKYPDGTVFEGRFSNGVYLL